MKFRINVSGDKKTEIQEFLESHGIETGEDAGLTIIESNNGSSFVSVRDDDRERMNLSAEEIIFIEAFGKDIEIHTADGTFYSSDRMYQLESVLDRKEFLRISKSVIISRKHVKKIRPSLSMKFILTMSDGTLLDVTRSYYNDFRRFFNI